MSEAAKILRELDHNLWASAEQAEESAGEQLKILKSAPAGTIETKSKIAGFTVIERVADEGNLQAATRLAARKRELGERREAAAQIKKSLSAQGLEPIAVLTRKTWDALCAEANLYRFETMDRDGKVVCENPLFDHALVGIIALLQLVTVIAFIAGSHPSLTKAALALASVPVFAFVSYLGMIKIPDEYSGWAFLTLLASVAVPETIAAAQMLAPAVKVPCTFITYILGTVGGIMLLCWSDSFMKSHATASFRFITKLVPKPTLNRMLWPDRYDKAVEKKGKDVNRVRVAIDFPQPPEDVAEVLKKASRLRNKICVAAVSEAIGVNTDEVIMEQMKDPIVYLNLGDQVAVLAQFGEFKVEKDLIKRISGVEYLC